VNHVYIALRSTLERQLRGQPLTEDTRNPVDPMTFVCEAIKAARLDMGQYAPALCASVDSLACNRLTIRLALNAVAAAVQHSAGGVDPRIPFELELAQELQGLRDAEPDHTDPESVWYRRHLDKLRRYALPDITTRPFESLGWYGGQEGYAAEQDSWWDKSYHFFTHAFLAYELRWEGIPAALAQTITDWQGRAYEVQAEVRGEVSPGRDPDPYSRNDVVANRWGAAFGSAFFDNPGRLVRECYRRDIQGCLVYQAQRPLCH
jgi:hypothetical protein